MSDCSRRAWMRPNLDETVWRRLPATENDVNVPLADEPHMVELRTRAGDEKAWPFAMREGDSVERLAVDGRRWTPARERDWDDCGVVE